MPIPRNRADFLGGLEYGDDDFDDVDMGEGEGQEGAIVDVGDAEDVATGIQEQSAAEDVDEQSGGEYSPPSKLFFIFSLTPC